MARLRACTTSESAFLFLALPSSRDGTRLSNAILQVAIGLRLGLPVATLGKFSCDAPLDELGAHALTCHKGVGKHARHSEVNSRIKAALAEASVVSVLEPVVLTRDDGTRPDGATVLPFENGLPMAWDATIIDTGALSHLHATAVQAGSGAAAVEAHMVCKYSCLASRVAFREAEFESLNAFGPLVRRLLDDIAQKIKSRTSDTRARTRLYRRIAAAIQTGNYGCITKADSRPSSP